MIKHIILAAILPAIFFIVTSGTLTGDLPPCDIPDPSCPVSSDDTSVFFPDHRNCSGFFECVDQCKLQQRCGPDKPYWSQADLTCVTDISKCSTAAACIKVAVTPPPSDPRCSYLVGTMNHTTCCNKVVICDGKGHTVEGICPPGIYFDTISKTCSKTQTQSSCCTNGLGFC